MSSNIERGEGQNNRADSYKEFCGDLDIFVPKIKEEEYLNSHGIEIRRLSNGALLSGATRRVEDASEANISIEFPTGSYYEPKGKGGVTHFLEHLILNEPGFLSRRVESYCNASTNVENVTLNLNGIANPKEPNYGIMPVVPVALKNVTKTPEFSREYLEREKRVIIGERQERLANPHVVNAESLFNIVFSEDNPINFNTIGSEEEVESINVNDAIYRHQEVFIPKGLDASVFSQGHPQTTSVLLDILEENLENMQGEGKNPQIIDRSLSEKLNPNFRQGETYLSDTGFKNGMVDINYIWIMSSIPYSVDQFSKQRMFELADSKLFEFLRESGLGYSSNTIDLSLDSEKKLMGFSLTVPKKRNIENVARDIYPQLKDKVFGSFGEEDFAHIDDITHKRLNAIPSTVSDRYSLAMHGLKDYGKVINSDKIPEIHKIISPVDLKRNMDSFTSVEPATLIIGDLS